MIYDAIETMLKAVVPADCRIFHANMPLQLMDTLTRETAKLCTYLVFQDRIHLNSSGASSVHEVTIEFSFYGMLSDVDAMAKDLNTLLVGTEVNAGGWRFVLVPAQNGKQDIWDPRIQVKREWLRYTGFAIEPEESQSAVTGTAG